MDHAREGVKNNKQSERQGDGHGRNGLDLQAPRRIALWERSDGTALDIEKVAKRSPSLLDAVFEETVRRYQLPNSAIVLLVAANGRFLVLVGKGHRTAQVFRVLVDDRKEPPEVIVVLPHVSHELPISCGFGYGPR